MNRILVVLGTRPEAIKLSPLIQQLRQEPRFQVRVCVTAQHRQMLDQVLDVFQITPDYDLDLMTPGQTLFQSTARMLLALEPVLHAENPDMVVVQGDTTTTLCGALAAFYQRIPVAHVEAGLRTHDMDQPFPEEANRVLTGRLAALHFAATPAAAANLRAEGVDPAGIHVTGNTGIDAVLYIRHGLEHGRLTSPPWPWRDSSKKLVLVTAHRRESFGPGFERICAAIAAIARLGVQVVYPVHPNPNVQNPVNRLLRTEPNVVLIEPLSYVPFVDLMRQSYLLITDSGGVQEEGPSLGKPILVLREKTERPEAVEAGTVKLVGTDPAKILAETANLLDNPEVYEAMQRVHNPYGDGHASARITNLMAAFLADKLKP